MRFEKVVATCLAAVVLTCSPMTPARGDEPVPLRDTYSDTWVAADGRGRTLPGRKECGPPRQEKYVGIFYFLWMLPRHRKVYDITEILKENPDNPRWGPRHAFHWWGRPHLGYYTSDDAFVIRAHAQLLADAGVDAVFFDVTNAFTYRPHYRKVCTVYRELRRAGRATPRVAFLTNTRSGEVVRRLYDDFYAKGAFRELWFRWDGKPLILARPEELSAKLKAFFTVRRSWAWSRARWFGDGKDKWPWLDNHPQKPGWRDDPTRPEQISVCAAQHPISNIGRSYHDGKQPPPERFRTDEGPCFAEQWKRARAVDPALIFVTGWNEWIAQRFVKEGKRGPRRMLGRELTEGDTYFVDQYNREYSRDIEPMAGGHGDNYYYQMVANIRRFKGVRAAPRPSPPVTVTMNTDFAQWEDVRPEYRDDLGDTVHRDHRGYGDAGRQVNRSGRNDIVAAKVARDQDHLYFYVRTAAPMTSPAGRHWMLLLLDTNGNHTDGWCGYDFVVNRTIEGEDAWLERSAGGWEWKRVAKIRGAGKGAAFHLRIPRQLLGLGGGADMTVDFKWADNIPDPPDPLDFIDRGDAAPNGRFNYRYRVGKDDRS